MPLRLIVRASRSDLPYCRGAECFVIPDICDSAALADAFRGVSHVVHLAGTIDERDPCELHRINVQGTRSVANAAQEVGVNRIVFLSSVAAVCSWGEDPITDATPEHPDRPYGVSKLAAENALVDALVDSPVEWVILRAPLVYGAGQKNDLVKLQKYVRRGVPLPFKWNQNRRSFISAASLASALEISLIHPSVARQRFLVADAKSWTPADLVAAIAEAEKISPRLFGMSSRGIRLLLTMAEALNHLGANIPLTRRSYHQLIGALEVDSTQFRRITKWKPDPRERELLQASFASSSPRLTRARATSHY